MTAMNGRYLSIAVLALSAASALVCWSGPPPAGQDAPTKRALLIGIDDYRSQSLRPLRGCANDVELMRSILVGKLDFEPENVVVLKNAEATRSAILSAIESHLIAASRPGDIALLHYSGHGSQMIDSSNDEVDGMDETIVPHDSRTTGVFDINDDEINGLMGLLSAKTPHVVFILDSCHSGSMARAAELGNAVRQTPPDLRDPPPAPPFAASRGIAEGADDFRLPGSGYVLISGCRANELANEASFDERRHGALTYSLVRALRAAGDRVTYRDVMEQVQADVSARFRSQHPQLEGTGIDTVVFGVERVLPRPYVLVEPDDGDPAAAKVGAGEIFGIVPDARLSVFPAGTRVFEDPALATGEIRITGVGPTSSDAVVESGFVAPRSRAVLDEIRPAGFQAAVFFDEGLDAVLRSALETALRRHDSVKLVAEREEAQLRVRQVDAVVVLEGRDLEDMGRIARDPSTPLERHAAAVTRRILDWAKWLSILAIDNPGPQLGLELRVSRAGAPPEEALPESVADGTEVTISVMNTSRQDVYYVILDLTSRGVVRAIYPPAGIEEAVSPGRSVDLTVPARVPEGADSVVDWIKVIATSDPLPAAVFELQPVARSVALATRDDESALERFLRRSVVGRTRDLGDPLPPVQVAGWATAESVLRVVRPQALIDGFAAHFDSTAEASRAADRLAGTRSVCGPGSAAGCYELSPFAGDPTMVEVRPPAVRSGDRAVRSIGQAFEEAYAMRQATGATRAEPLIDHQVPRAQTAPHEDDPRTRGGGGQAPDPRAEGNPLWSLQYIRVPEAWAEVRSVTGRPEGLEAQGVVIAHPDTGYLEHPEIWQPSGAGPVWPEMGYDYYGDGASGDDDPTDDMLDAQPLDNPVHGTGSGSAIVSPTGCQLAGAQKCPTGAARGARLVPLRVDRSVVHFDTRRMTQAILDASGEDRTRVKTASDVMSISMGGVPSWALWKAVKQAEERGYLIIAAAGNYVKTVVWPARFKSTIAMAAVNAGCKPWRHTSLGPSVDFSAPGESVWRATLDPEEELITGMGTGTTYATATMAGVAGLWVARHRGTDAFKKIRRHGQTTQVFRQLVGQTVWQPGSPNRPAAAACDADAGWRPFFYGDGIVDAAALLAAPLADATGVRAAGAERIQDLPLWTSLYGDETPLQVAQQDYRQLFGAAPGDELETVAIYEAEVLYHYTMSEGVAEAIDRLIAGDRGAAAHERMRQALRSEDLSTSLRQALAVP